MATAQRAGLLIGERSETGLQAAFALARRGARVPAQRLSCCRQGWSERSEETVVLSLARCLTPDGLEQGGLLTPVEHGEDVPDVFEEEAVRCRAELGKKE